MAVDAQPRTPRKGRHAARRKQEKGPGRRRGLFRRYWWVLVAVPLLGGAMVFATLFYVYLHIQLPKVDPPLQTSYIYDRNGNLLTTLHAAVNRTIVPFSDMPASLRDATIATEDKEFYQHPGFDPLGIARAAWNDVVLRRPIQGGSTITQQLVKNVYAGRYVTNQNGERIYKVPPRSIGQKVREVLLAVKLEQEMTKDQILATYLNTIYFGHGAYGVEAAAQTYWQEDAKDLTLLQSATLAGMVASPETFDPIDNKAAAKDRRNYVLDRMVQEGYVTQQRATQMQQKKIRTDPVQSQQRRASYPAPFFVDYAKRTLLDDYGSQAVFGGGLHVTTSLDLRLQRAAEDAVKAHLPHERNGPEAALVALDPRTGEVLALVGGHDYEHSQVNLALSGAKGFAGSGRSAGSAFKPFTLAAALEKHISLSSVWSGPSTITIPDRECYTNGVPWQPSNAADEESGTFTLADATKYSVNTVFAQLVTQVGPEKVADMANRLGIRSKLPDRCSITLGAVEVNPLEMTNAYATFADRGVRHDATPFVKVKDSTGKPIYRADEGHRVISTNDAALVDSALQGVVEGGTGTAAGPLPQSRPVAGKTGTAQNYVDAWFCGYTPQLATCVWMGYPKGETPMYNIGGYYEVFGGTIPALIWHDFMTTALDGRRVLDFPTPSNYYAGGSVTPTPAYSPTTSPTPTQTTEPKPTKTQPPPTPTSSESPPPTPT